MSKKHRNILEIFQEQVGLWAYENFGKPQGKSRAQHDLIDTNDPLMGMVEELGELHHAILKRKQMIRVGENHDGKERDAIGDLLIYCLDYCSRRGFSCSDILKTTWENVVNKRNWIENPETGGVVSKELGF